MSFSLNGGLLAMEEIDNTGEDLGEVEAAEVAATVADESAEIQTANTEIGIEVAKVEDAVQAGEELEALGDLAADSLENGEGMTEETAEAVSIAVESILNRLGASRTTRTVPVAESFGNVSSRRVSTKLVVEGIGDWLKKIWMSIKQAALRIWDKISNFVAGLFNSAKTLQKHLISLRDRVKKVPSNAVVRKKNIDSKSLAKNIGWDKKADLGTFKMLVENAKNLQKASVTANQEILKVSEKVRSLLNGGKIDAESVKKFLSEKNTSVSAIKADGLAGMELSATQAVVNAKPSDKSKVDGTVTITHYGPFAGGAVLTIENDTGQAVKFKAVFEGSSAKKAEKVEALNISGVEEVISISLDLVNKIIDDKSVAKYAKSSIDGQVKSADMVIKNAESILGKTGAEAATKQALADLRTVFADSITSLNTFCSNSPTLVFRTARAGADYASISLRNLGDKKDSEDGDDE